MDIESQERVISAIWSSIRYWASEGPLSLSERLEGLAFGILTTLDDQAHQNEGHQWPTGVDLHNQELHELFCEYGRKWGFISSETEEALEAEAEVERRLIEWRLSQIRHVMQHVEREVLE